MIPVCQRSSNHKLKAIHNVEMRPEKGKFGVSKIVKSQIESNSQRLPLTGRIASRCVKDRQITNWKQFTTRATKQRHWTWVCQRSSNHKLKAIHNLMSDVQQREEGVSKIVKSQIESNSQLTWITLMIHWRCVKDRQITNWKQFTTKWPNTYLWKPVCQRSSNHKLKAIHNAFALKGL